jgi:N-acetylneuraminic acid mutarotase
MPEGVQGLAMVAHKRSLVRVGGMMAKNAAGKAEDLASVAEVARFDVERGAWEPLPPMPAGRSSHHATIIGDTLYVVGGWQLANGSETWHETMLSLDLAAAKPAWKSSPAPVKRRGIAAVALGANLAVLGGLDPDENASHQVDVYDVAKKQWGRAPDFPGEGFGVAAYSAKGVVYASGKDGVVYRLAPGDKAWSRAATLAFPRFFHQIVQTTDGRLVFLGGIPSKYDDRTRVVEALDLGLGPGKTRPAPAEQAQIARLTLKNPSLAKNRQGVFLNDGSLYVFGGNSSLEQHDFEPERFQKDGHVLHLASLTWRSMAPYPVPRQTMQTVWANGAGYALGGFGHDGTTARAHDEVYRYDPRADAWSPRKVGLPSRRTQFGAAAYDGRLWVFGGLDYDDTRGKDDHFRHLASVLAAPIDEPNGTAGRFEDVNARLPSPRRAFAGAVLGKTYYAIGGMREEFKLVDDAIAFDFDTKTWRSIAKPRRVRLSAELVALGDKLVLFGGSSAQGAKDLEPDRSVEIYDPKTDAWKVLVPELPFDTKHARLFAFEGRLLVYTAHREDPTVELALITP